MNTVPNESAPAVAAPRPLRIWPALVLFALVGISQILPLLLAEPPLAVFMFSIFAPLLAGVGLLLWWILASRATPRERLLGPMAVLFVAAVSYWLLHPSIGSITGGVLYLFVLPSGLVAMGLALVVLYRARPNVRLWGAIIGALIGFASWTMIRSDGVTGEFKVTFAGRWTPTAEELYLASLKQGGASQPPPASAGAELQSAALDTPAWPGFRGPNRDGSVPGVILATDWQAHPPKEIWRRQVGPGWSSFAVAGRSVFTQEQRGEVEVVACYDADTGAVRWAHQSPARFWESTAGAGPRATPTLALGRLFTVGATGLVHCLDPSTGDVVWQRDLTKDAERQPPTWGFSSSPLVVGNVVIVYAGGAGDKGIFAYDINTGQPRWSAAAGESYSSPHRASVAGQDVVLMFSSGALAALNPADGSTVWTYKLDGGNCLQPLVVQPSSILFGTGFDTRRVEVTLSEDVPLFKDSWASHDMKPTFNDYVAHQGSLFGFDGSIFACVDLETGKKCWKKGRYGNGQVLLLPDANQLLVVGETGEVVLLGANNKRWEELANLKVLSGKTWNHPALVAGRLYVRNGEEAVCLELPLAETSTVAVRPEVP